MNINWNDKAFYAQVVEQVEEIGLSRMKSQPRMDEADFRAAAGAMAALTALGLEPVQYPAGWTLGIMFGRPPLARRMAEQPQEPHHDRVA